MFNIADFILNFKIIPPQLFKLGDILAWCLMPNHFHLMV